MTEVNQSDGQGSASATPGCFILGAIVTVFGGLIILYITVFMIQKRSFATFTEDEAAKIEIYQPEAEAIERLLGKLDEIRSATDGERKERILLTADDLNTLIATTDILKDFRGTTFISDITSQGIRTRMTQPTRKMPFSREQRYLNATFVLQPELRRRTIAFRVKDIISDRGTVPAQFVKSYDAIGFFRIDPENKVIEKTVPRLSRVYTEDGHVVIETGVPAADQSPLD